VNARYFICKSCKTLCDADDRRAYWFLEKTVVCLPGTRVDVASVLAARDYWLVGTDPEEGELSPIERQLWRERLAFVRGFLVDHADHDLFFGEEEHAVAPDSLEVLDWLEVGPDARPTLRSLISEIPVPTWDEVCILVGANPHKRPWWWGMIPEADVRRAFDRLRVG
jgi:hypothetical protein